MHATNKLYDEDFMNRLNLPEKLDGGFVLVCTYFNGVDDLETIRIFTILKKIGIDTVFTTDAFTSVCSFMGIKVKPLPLHVHDPVDETTPKDVVCSFIGFKSFPIREYVTPLGILDHYYIKLHAHAIAFYLTDRQDRRMLKREYMDVLARSRFSLCPRGYEPGIFRFWESLQAGAIPILISDNWKLPGTRTSWKNCTYE